MPCLNLNTFADEQVLDSFHGVSITNDSLQIVQLVCTAIYIEI